MSFLLSVFASIVGAALWMVIWLALGNQRAQYHLDTFSLLLINIGAAISPSQKRSRFKNDYSLIVFEQPNAFLRVIQAADCIRGGIISRWSEAKQWNSVGAKHNRVPIRKARLSFLPKAHFKIWASFDYQASKVLLIARYLLKELRYKTKSKRGMVTSPELEKALSELSKAELGMELEKARMRHIERIVDADHTVKYQIELIRDNAPVSPPKQDE